MSPSHSPTKAIEMDRVLQCNKNDHYRILNVNETSTLVDIKKSYRKIALLCHPDQNRHHQDQASDAFKIVQAAYEALCDPNRGVGLGNSTQSHKSYREHEKASQAGSPSHKSRAKARRQERSRAHYYPPPSGQNFQQERYTPQASGPTPPSETSSSQDHSQQSPPPEFKPRPSMPYTRAYVPQAGPSNAQHRSQPPPPPELKLRPSMAYTRVHRPQFEPSAGTQYRSQAPLSPGSTSRRSPPYARAYKPEFEPSSNRYCPSPPFFRSTPYMSADMPQFEPSRPRYPPQAPPSPEPRRAHFDTYAESSKTRARSPRPDNGQEGSNPYTNYFDRSKPSASYFTPTEHQRAPPPLTFSAPSWARAEDIKEIWQVFNDLEREGHSEDRAWSKACGHVQGMKDDRERVLEEEMEEEMKDDRERVLEEEMEEEMEGLKLSERGSGRERDLRGREKGKERVLVEEAEGRQRGRPKPRSKSRSKSRSGVKVRRSRPKARPRARAPSATTPAEYSTGGGGGGGGRSPSRPLFSTSHSPSYPAPRDLSPLIPQYQYYEPSPEELRRANSRGGPGFSFDG